MPAALDLERVTKIYPNHILALDGLAMRVESGTIFGLLGPNGAGKSTLVKVLMTLVRPQEALGTMLGQPLGDPSTLRRTGYLPENPSWPDHLNTEQLLDFAGRLHGLGSSKRRHQVEEMLALTGLKDWRKDRARVFSKGMRQRLGLAHALMGDPDLVFLDEPTDGVDPIGRKEMRDIIMNLKRQGKTVFVNSHVLGELELMCDSVAIMSRGRVVRQGSIEELTRESFRYETQVEGDVRHDQGLQMLVETLGGKTSFDETHRKSVITLPTRRPHLIQPIIDEIRRHGYLLISVAPARQSLEELFLEAIRAGRPGSADSNKGGDS